MRYGIGFCRAVIFLVLFSWVVIGVTEPLVSPPTQAPEEQLKALRALLEWPDSQLDLARIMLTVDRMIDPTVDIDRSLAQLETMANVIKLRFPANPSRRDKLEVLRTYVYQAGPWNGYQPFRYDLTDPLGRILRNKLLTTYLTTRKGNCVSMPLLFIILGQKIGLDLTASLAPEHLFVKYRDENGLYLNLEATSGAGVTRDVGYVNNSL